MKSFYISKCIDSLDYLKVVPSYRCERGCSYCYNDALEQSAEGNGQAFFTSIAGVLEQARNSFVAEIIGGEPLERETAARTLQTLEMLDAHPLCRKIILSTALGDSKHLDQVLRWVDFVYFSVDITRAKTNKKRTSKRYLADLVRRIKDSRTELCISVVLDSSESVAEVTSFLNDLVELGVENVCFGFISFSKLNEERVAKYAAVFHALFRAKCILRKEMRIGGDILETLDMHITRQVRSHNCHCGETCVVIQPDGKLSPSICFADKPGSAISFDEYMNAKQQREAALKNSSCGSCELWGACQGGCMGAAVSASGRLLSKDESMCGILCSAWKSIKVDVGDARAVSA